MNIRPIQEKDIPVVVDLIHRNLNGIISKYHSRDVVRKLKSEVTPNKIREHMIWRRIFVVESNAWVVASGALADFGTAKNPKHSLSYVFVTPTMQNMGIGKSLIEYLFNTARNIGINVLHVPSSLNAISFYQQRGFIKDETQPDWADEITWMTIAL